MTEKPILFSGEMVRAILNGTKTQTRRCHIKPQPPDWWTPDHFCDICKMEAGEFVLHRNGDPIIVGWGPCSDDGQWGYCLPYRPDDLLWVRETWTIADDGEILYRADPSVDFANQCEPAEDRYRWRPSIHMFKDCARLWLKVTGVRVERLQGITWENALAEGITIPVTPGRHPLIRVTGKCPPCKYIKKDASSEEIIIGHFASLWDSIYGKKEGFTWRDNPWIAVYEFERISK